MIASTPELEAYLKVSRLVAAGIEVSITSGLMTIANDGKLYSMVRSIEPKPIRYLVDSAGRIFEYDWNAGLVAGPEVQLD